jgi:hypothetical protein
VWDVKKGKKHAELGCETPNNVKYVYTRGLIFLILFRRALVWDVKKGKKHSELGWETPNNVKYMYKRVKFACVEGDIKRYKGDN